MTGIDRTTVDAWQGWLALEHEAVWLYGVIGGRVEDFADAARLEWNRHRDTRDRLTGLIRAADAEPVGPRMGYAVGAIDGRDAARSAAQDIEGQVSAAAMSCLTDGPLRSEVVTALRGSAETAADWGAKPSAFPGLTLRG